MRWFLTVVSTIMLVAITALVPTGALAASVPPAPYSHYVGNLTGTASTDNSNWYNVGCSDAQSVSGSSFGVILDFSGQSYNSSAGWGTIDWNGNFHNNADIEAAAEGYVLGWYACSPSTEDLTLVIGTNNSGTISSSAGSAWAQVVSAVSSYISASNFSSQIEATGGIDAEVEYASYSATENWDSGWGTGIYFDYGDAGGCPESGTTSTSNGSCNNGWTQQEVAQVSWVNPGAFPFPEIYNTTGANADQWQQISLYSYYHGTAAAYFNGPLSQYEACLQVGGCSGVNNTPSESWTQLWDALNGSTYTAQTTMPWVGDIEWN